MYSIFQIEPRELFSIQKLPDKTPSAQSIKKGNANSNINSLRLR